MGLSPEFTNDDLYVFEMLVRNYLQLKAPWKNAILSRTTSAGP